ncbi:MAG: ABC transporter ATP-binding protein, partial [Clostridia bacterium]|nr:ABC transporter ATP-binding protein [Clostridia bacterium]
MKIIIKYLRPFFKRMTVGFLIKVTATVFELALPYILSHILKSVVVKNDIKQVLLWGGVMVVCALMACILNIIANRMAARVSSNFSEIMRHKLFERILDLSARQRDHFTIPSLESRVTTDTYNVHHFVGMMQRMGVRAPILLIGGIIITLIMDSFLALVMICVLPLIFITVYF